MCVCVQAIRAMHAAGLEVVVAVEFCITGEGSDALSGGLHGMRGIDAAVYYRWVCCACVEWMAEKGRGVKGVAHGSVVRARHPTPKRVPPCIAGSGAACRRTLCSMLLDAVGSTAALVPPLGTAHLRHIHHH